MDSDTTRDHGLDTIERVLSPVAAPDAEQQAAPAWRTTTGA